MSEITRHPNPHLPPPGPAAGGPADDPGTAGARPGRPLQALDALHDPPRWQDPRQGGEMPFLSHLDELRRVILWSLIGASAGAIGGWFLAPVVLEDLIRRTVGEAVVLSPLEAFNERLKLSFFLGVMIALPWVLWQIWSFVMPGLFRRERRWILPMVLASMLLFLLGVWAAYGYVVPLVVHVLEGFMTPGMKAQIRLSSLLGFAYNMCVACGLVFQLPLVTMTLTAIGLVTPGFLLRQWRFAIVGAFLVTALITPGDVVTAQLVMGVPMLLLYFLSVGLSFLVARRRRDPPEDVAGKGDHAVET